MTKIWTTVAVMVALPAWAAAHPAPSKNNHHPRQATASSKKTPRFSAKRPCKPSAGKGIAASTTGKGKTVGATKVATAVKPASPIKAAVPVPRAANEAAKPDTADPDRERVLQLQEALDGIVRGKVLGRLRVGMRVEDLATGRVLFGWRGSTPMDPASNQKVLGTTTALLRLGSDYRYRTEVTGAAPDVGGAISGDIVLRGSGDPSLRPRHLDELAETLATQGVTAVEGDVLGDPRRIGSDELGEDRPPLRVGSSSIEVHVRPGEKAGNRPIVSVQPASDLFTVVNQAETRAKGKASVSVAIERSGHRFQVVVGGRVSIARGEVVVRQAPPSAPLFAAFLLRQALVKVGIEVHGGVGIYGGDARPRLSSARPPRPIDPMEGALLALATAPGDSMPALAATESHQSYQSHQSHPANELLAIHESEPLAQLLRRVNKDSDNEWAERVLETVGAEVFGGAATTAKGVRALRETLAELGLPAGAYSPANGSGLGHQNRVTAAGMAALLRQIYFDPRIGPELMQSLSVGGVDGTTRNRFRGSLAAHRVRAKTGTLSGVSCLSGFVGDASDVLVFSILVEGHRRRAVPSVRTAQVNAVNAMMRFARKSEGPLPDDSRIPNSTDFESGEELDEVEGPAPDSAASSEPEHAGQPSP
jgi:D-alanyl-D-alanine carboxypeptidase/D-alanyl-D-alanine-endopeptidase (penicillin-binding protein 4)